MSFYIATSYFGHSMSVGHQPMKPLSFVCPSACPSITKFSQDSIIRFLIFYMMIGEHGRYLVTDKARFLRGKKKKIGSMNLGLMGLNQSQIEVLHNLMGLNQAQIEVLCHFLEFGS